MSLEISTVDVTPKDGVYGDICLYVLDNGEYLTLIESGPSNGLPRLIEWLHDNGYRTRDIRYILLTHIHLDHGGSAGYIVEDNHDIKVYVHPRGYQHLIDPSKLWRSSLDTIGYVAEIYGEPKPIPKENLVTVGDGDRLDIDLDVIRFIYTPGHATHHISIYLEEEKILFPGDSLGLYHENTVIPTSPKPHNVEKSLNSISKMKSLHPRKLGFTHFGIVGDASKTIEKYEIIYRKWVKLVEEGYKSGVDIIEIYERLKREDINVYLHERFFRERGYGEEEVIVSLYGIYSYFEYIDRKSIMDS